MPIVLEIAGFTALVAAASLIGVMAAGAMAGVASGLLVLAVVLVVVALAVEKR